MKAESLFRSFFIGGFECATHRARPRGGNRIDMVAATRHDELALQDYERLRSFGISTARDGLRWHLIEREAGRYDWSSLLPVLRAARATGVQVMWDLLHYGYPDWLDIFTPEFVRRFAGFARRFALLLKEETNEPAPFISLVNEISYFAWGGGQTGRINPFAKGRADDLKGQLVRAAIEATEAVWSVLPAARLVHCDPAINVVFNPERRTTQIIAGIVHGLQYEAWDMLAGHARPELGGAEKYLDIIGVNYYWNNQWVVGLGHDGYERTVVVRGDGRYRPFHRLLREVYERYGRPLFVAETGIEGDARAGWLAYIGDEVRACIASGFPVEGICLYPIINHPGWDDDRHCHNGLWDYADANGGRAVYEPLARELRRQQELFARTFALR